jgi:15-cis-phytoene synthase
MTTVDQAYAEVERITRHRARNFAYGIMLLPKPKRRAIAAIYAFAREVDDIADEPALGNDVKRARLVALRERVDGEPGADAMLVALADARRRFQIPTSALHDLVDGGLQDTEQRRYATFEELRAYCRRVAGAVGVACVGVYGAPDERRRAETLGIALQLINIIRDVREDWELGRIYIPQDELTAAGVSEKDIAEGRCTDEWRALMAHQAARARSFLAEGRTLLPLLDRRSAACVAAFANLYAATLDRIEERGFDVFSGPPQMSSLTKLRIAGSGLVR